MLNLTTIILLVLVLYFVQLFLQETSKYKFDFWSIVGNRDNPPDTTIIAARLERAKNNMLEALPLFLTLAILSLIKEGDKSTAIDGATIFFIARLFYVPSYMSGIPILRSIFWLVANAGLILMAIPLVCDQFQW